MHILTRSRSFIVAVSWPFMGSYLMSAPAVSPTKLILLALFGFFTPERARLRGGEKKRPDQMREMQKVGNQTCKTIYFLWGCNSAAAAQTAPLKTDSWEM